MAIQKSKLCAVIVEIGMDVVLLGNPGKATVIEEPHSHGCAPYRSDFHRAVINAGAIDVVIETIMKKVDAVAALGIGGTNPDGASNSRQSVGAPRHLFIGQRA